MALRLRHGAARQSTHRLAQSNSRARGRAAQPRPSALLDFLRPKPANKAPGAVEDLLAAIEGTERGLEGGNRPAIDAAVAELERRGSGTTDSSKLSGTWRLLWTTEKETLWIIKNAGLFGTQAGEVYQVIDPGSSLLQNVITFPPEGAFIVDASIAADGPQRTRFRFEAATLKLPGGRALALPPFGKGWFDTVYADGAIRVSKDVRGDTLVCVRDGPPRAFS